MTVGTDISIRTALAAAAVACIFMTWFGQARAEALSDADVARIVRSLPQVTDADLEREAGRAARPVDPGRFPAKARGGVNLDALPKPSIGASPDLDAFTKGIGAEADAVASARRAISREPALLVFVSFTMPEGSLARLVSQAERAGATLVLRGPTKNSVKETVLAVQRLIGNRKVAFQLDPESFDRYGVSVAPTFVLVSDAAGHTSCGGPSCGAAERFARVAGDVSIDYALEFMQRNATGMQQEAGALLRKARGS